MKPDIELFKIALEESGYNDSETVMVGDRLDNKIHNFSGKLAFECDI